MNEEVMNFFKKLKGKTSEIYDTIYGRYKKFEDATNIFSKNLEDLFNYSHESLVLATNRNTSISNSYADFLFNQNRIYSKMGDVKKSFLTLEDVIAPDNVRVEKTSMSRLESAYLSTIAGIVTISNYYNYLRNKSSENTLTGKNKFIKNDTEKKSPYSVEQINEVLSMKKRYFWKEEETLTKLVKKECKIKINSVDDLVKDAMHLKISDKNYSNIRRIDYDSKIASYAMKMELENAYMNSEKTLKVIASEFEQKYGMHVSVSTISTMTRKELQKKGLFFKNRRETKKYFNPK